MRKLHLLAFLAFACFKSNAQTSLSKKIDVNGVTREYRVYIPALYSSTGQPVPLVFNFHGYSSTNIQQALYAGFRRIADTANFILVYPQGLPIPLGSVVELGFNNFDTLGTLPDEIGFVNKMIDILSIEYNINLNRIYCTGMSNGGFMSYDLACFLNNRFAAIASVAGSMVNSHFTACNPGHPTPVMQIHGTLDTIVPFNGNGLLPTVPVDNLLNWWVAYNNCNPTPNVTHVPNTSIIDMCIAKHYVYNGGTNGSTVELFKVFGGGHTWPGTTFPIPIAGGNTNQDFDASQEIWRFFRKYSLDQLLANTTVNPTTELNVSVSPNPSNGILKLSWSNDENYNVDFFSTFGTQILSFKNMSNSSYLDLSKVPKGIYFYRISNKRNNLKIGKVIIE
jgi:polyhydroxybutyrate depolymerase